MIPDHARRRKVEAEMPRVPLSFYEATLDMPSTWFTTRCVYVLVSYAYREAAQQAGDRGWRVVKRPELHLDIVNDGDGFARAILGIVEGWRAALMARASSGRQSAAVSEGPIQLRITAQRVARPGGPVLEAPEQRLAPADRRDVRGQSGHVHARGRRRRRRRHRRRPRRPGGTCGGCAQRSGDRSKVTG